MKLTKKLTIMLSSATIMTTLFTGCSTKDVEPVRTETAEEAINLFNEYNKSNDIENMVSLYSNVYLDSVGYTSGTVVKLLKNNRKDIEITKSETESIEAIDENTEMAVVNMAFKEKDEETAYTYNYALVKEENGWAVSPDGVIGCTNIESKEIEKNKLNLNLTKAIELVDGYILRVDVANTTSSAYSFGGEGNLCEVKVETTEGAFTTVMEDEVKLDKKVNSYFMARFDSLEGDITKVTVSNIYDVKDDAVVAGSGRDIIIYEK